MSYCRFSSDNWMSDVYVYEDVMGGWTTHVASRRRLFGPVPDIPMSGLATWLHRWFGGEWNPQTREFTYPSKFKRTASRLWYSLLAFWHSKIHMGSLQLIPMRKIGKPFDGETFNDPSPAECADRLEWLRGQGYRVPQGAIDSLREEAAELAEEVKST